jgi:hypothetical protein
MSWNRIALMGLVGISLAGCKETTSSENIRTRGIAMEVEVIARSESHARVRATLLVGGDESNTYVNLKGGDRLVAYAGDEEQVMEEVDDGIYETVFENGEGGTIFTVDFERDGDDDAPDSEGRLPEPFDFTSDFGDSPISRRDDAMEITWEPFGEDDDMDIAFADEGASCIFDEDDDIPGDSGSYLLEPDALRSTSSNDPKTCDVEATVTRTRSGSNDNALDSESSFTLQQVRRFRFVSAP